jgi:gluconolactonase
MARSTVHHLLHAAGAAAIAVAAFALSPPAAAQDTRLRDICGECVLERFAKCEGKHFLEGPAFDRQGRLWVTGLESGAVLRVEPNGQCSVVTQAAKAINGAKFDAQQRLLLTDVESGLLRLDTSTHQVSVVRAKHGREMFRGLNDIAVDQSGGIYFTESWGSHALKRDGRVFYLPADDVEAGKRDLVVVASGIAFPNGVVLSPDEKALYVGEYAQNQILKLPLSAPGTVSANGVPYVFARLVGGTGPDGMAVDAAGNLYAAHFRAGEVVVIDEDGFPYGAIRLPKGSGLGATNVALHGGYLYITEAFKDEVWRTRVNTLPHPLPNLRQTPSASAARPGALPLRAP